MQLTLHGFWQSERGFTVIEVLVTIIIMGIVVAIASSTWFGVVESRRVDSATNQMASDLRRAQTTATSRLANWRVELDSDTRNYRIGPSGGTLASHSLEEGTRLTTAVTVVEFEPNGEAQMTGSGNVRIAAEDGSPCHEIEINEITSRIKVVTNVC